MKKRLILCLDGTWNNVEDNTNVWRLSQLVATKGADGVPQQIYYTPGVGTARGERLRGGSLGYGLDRDIVAAYRWLMGHYDQGEEIFLFGFSRGAFTARSLAGMIVRCGLLRPGSPLSIEELFERYRLDDKAPSLVELYERDDLNAEERRLLRHSRRVPIKMIGVWDTVGALGVPFGNIPGLSRRRFGFHNTRLSTIFEHAYHALAIDEHRHAFSPTLWTRFVPTAAPDPDKRRTRPTIVEQRWFAGAHANVGGGIGGDDMSQMPLAWLMEKAAALGVGYRGDIRLRGHEIAGDIYDSFREFAWGFYALAKLGKRHHRIIAPQPRDVDGGQVVTVGETIDASVFDRWRADPSYRPESIARWGAVRTIDPSALRGTIDAESGKPVVVPAKKTPRARPPVKPKAKKPNQP